MTLAQTAVAETKICCACPQNGRQPVENFNKNIRKKDGRDSRCKVCARLSAKESYRRHRKKVMHRSYHRRIGYNARLAAMKSERGCYVCGEQDDSCLDFHHIDPSIKDDVVRNVVKRGAAWPTIVAEVEKCLVLCANHHRQWHAGRFCFLPRENNG